jgi:membrane associated rhomboid family serine protease
MKSYLFSLTLLSFLLYSKSFTSSSLLTNSFLNLNHKNLNNRKLFATTRNIKTYKQPAKQFKFPIVNTLIFANVAMFFLTSKFPALKNKYMKYDHRIARGELYRLFSSLFLHGSIYHLFVNSYSLSQIGPDVSSFNSYN